MAMDNRFPAGMTNYLRTCVLDERKTPGYLRISLTRSKKLQVVLEYAPGAFNQARLID
ncbi:MAG: hypothetical protein ACU88J_07910 [Gammaproteobacteria bacterium]